MKKLLLSVVLGLAVAGSAAASTMVHMTQRMLTGTYLAVSNSTVTATITTSTSNIWYYSYAQGTNILALSTNANGSANYPPALVSASLVPDMNADVNPNLALQIVAGYTNNLFTAGVQSPVMLNTVWLNPTPTFMGTGFARGTNLVTITLIAVGSAGFNVPDTGLGGTVPPKQFQLTFYATNSIGNGTPIVITTNLPTSFLQGAAAIYPTIALTAVDGATNGITINGLNLVGWSP